LIPRIAHLKETIQGWIAVGVDLTLEELKERLAGQGVPLSVSGIWHQLDKWGVRFKKNAARQRAGTRRRAVGTGSLDSGAAVSGGEIAEIHR
jgi:transposase